jgi:hypothetical protein
MPVYDQKADEPIVNLRHVTAELRTRGEIGLANMVELATSELVAELTELKNQLEEGSHARS